MTLAEIYLKAAEIVRTNGHAKGAFHMAPETGSGIELAPAERMVCAAGAVSVAMYSTPEPPTRLHERRDEFDEVIAQLTPRIENLHLYSFEGEPAVMRLAGWNDAEERTAAEVIDLFERTAREVA